LSRRVCGAPQFRCPPVQPLDSTFRRKRRCRDAAESRAIPNELMETVVAGIGQKFGTGRSLKEVGRPVAAELEGVKSRLKGLVSDKHPAVQVAAGKVFAAGGKLIRPLLTLLIARASTSQKGSLLDPKAVRLAEITEMIHTASLLHDDVLDSSLERRGELTVNAALGARVAILAGDFLFAEASWGLARLENLEVIKLISKVIADFASGELAQAQSLYDPKLSLFGYQEKNYRKTASLMEASARGAAIFSGASPECIQASTTFGKELGLTFQIVDDILDINGDAGIGKPRGQDLASGTLTAPVLFALEDGDPNLVKVIKRRFKEKGDLDTALNYVMNSNGIERARELAQAHGNSAKQALEVFEPSPARDSLYTLVDLVLNRLY